MGSIAALQCGGLQKDPSDSSEDKWQLFLPEKHREIVLGDLHDHDDLRPERTFKLVRDQFYWPCMRADVEGYCHSFVLHAMKGFIFPELPQWATYKVEDLWS